MRTNLLVAIVALACVVGSTVEAQRTGTGAGVIVGEPTGLSLKHWVATNRAVAAAAAWSLEGHNSLQLHADYLFHDFDALKSDLPDQMAVYYGLGARVRFDEERGRGDDDETTLGVRFPVGLNFFLTKAPVDIFLEIVPVLEIVPSTELDLDAAIGVRYFFK